MREPIIYVKIVINFILLILTVLFLIFILPKIIGFFIPFVIGWIVSMIANPLVKFLEKRVKLLRKHSSALIIIIVIAAIVGTLYLLIAFLVKEISSLTDDLPEIIDRISLQFEALSNRLSLASRSLPKSIRTGIDDMFKNMGDYLSKEVTIDTAGTFAKNIAEVFLMTIISILSAYFFIAKRDELIDGIKKIMPNSINNGWYIINDNFKTAVGGYFKAQFKIMLIITVIMFVGFEVLTVGYSFLLALGIAFLDFLPVFGTGAVLWPWAIIDMLTGNYMRAIGLIVIYLICQVIKQVLQPKMVGDSVGISPLATLFFMFTGYRFYGVLGMILGIPIGMVLVNLYRVGVFDRFIKGLKIITHDINEFRKF
ncbi:sporulation integral membrane protein YtvI [Mobilitalea sibirica]|uniref:Sporulation integral membrane protein YtvI n=1 Tax=Mobilitalea sibirica TaxID=1462919 RepID=A0A8J7L2D0_9FIRM|nr:sporulation integral membrane protein YtvI [Mobilitalea sibirica]MBH1940328.1 sporulation integral membrane protein YtvI [Mobilitalea sibirica]